MQIRLRSFASVLLLAIILTATKVAAEEIQLRTGLFYRFTDLREGGAPLPDNWLTLGLSGFIGVDMFNSRDGSLIPAFADIAACPVYFDEVMYDDGSTPIGAMVAYRSEAFNLLIGPGRSVSSVPVAILGGIDEVPQISYWATTPALDDREFYPYFMRTIPADTALALAVMDYLVDNGMLAVQVMYADEDYGSAYSRALTVYGDEMGVQVNTVGFTDGDVASVAEALKVVKDSHLHIIVCMSFDSYTDFIIDTAREMGIMGSDYLWIWTDSLSEGYLEQYSKPHHIEGHIRFQSIGGIPDYEPWMKFQEYMYGITNLNERYSHRLPAGVTVADDLLEHTYIDTLSAYSMDAVAAFGLAACAMYDDVGHVDATKLLPYAYATEFAGISGHVKFDKVGSRDGTTGNHVLQNVRVVNGAVELLDIGRWYSGDHWVFTTLPVYPDGSSEPPTYVAIPEEQTHRIGAWAPLGYTLFGIQATACAIFFIWVVIYRDAKVVRRAQPQFLLVIIVGTMISSSTLIPLSIADDGNVDLEETSDKVSRANELDASCQTIPWLYCMGFTITFSTLLAKIRRIQMVFINPSLKKIRLRVKDTAITMAPIIISEVAILFCWQFIDPLQWQRKIISTDMYGYPEESIGRCVNSNPWDFIQAILVVHLVGIIYALILAYRGREIPTDFQEGSWISVSLFCYFQILLLSIPLLILVADDPVSAYFLRCAIIFLNDFSVLCLMFIPKIRRWWSERDDPSKQGKSTSAVKSDSSRDRTKSKGGVEMTFTRFKV